MKLLAPFFVCSALLCVTSCAPLRAGDLREPPVRETVLRPGTKVTVMTSQGAMSATALSTVVRRYTWRDRQAQDELGSRGTKYRWYGAFGIYDPGAEFSGRGWTEMGNLGEAQIFFSDRAGALRWLTAIKNSAESTYKWTSDGLVVNFDEALANPSKNFPGVFTADIQQICVAGKKPRNLPGASDSAIHVTTFDGKPAQTLPCSNPGPVNNDIEVWPPLPSPTP